MNTVFLEKKNTKKTQKVRVPLCNLVMTQYDNDTEHRGRSEESELVPHLFTSSDKLHN